MITQFINGALLILFLYGCVIFIRSTIGAYKQKKALNGGYGEEERWKMELIEEKDLKFRGALECLSKMEEEEVKIIADSKTALRERAIDRAREEYQTYREWEQALSGSGTKTEYEQ